MSEKIAFYVTSYNACPTSYALYFCTGSDLIAKGNSLISAIHENVDPCNIHVLAIPYPTSSYTQFITDVFSPSINSLRNFLVETYS